MEKKINIGKKIGIGIIGAGYMGKAHAVAYASVASVFEMTLRPSLEMICTTRQSSAAEKAEKFGFHASTDDWRALVHCPAVEAVIIAAPQSTHRQIATEALNLGKPVFCEKPLGRGLADAQALSALAEEKDIVTMMGFNYIRTPASQLAKELIANGEIGTITHFRGEHTEDFLADPARREGWRTTGRANGVMGDLAPHMINAALRLVGPISALVADIYQAPMPDGPTVVENDDIGQMLCKFQNGAHGMMHFSRVAGGRKMGYGYEIFGTKGAIRFDQEDQNALWYCKGVAQGRTHGFTKILTGPEHPDYLPFCQGPGHGTGYQDQIIIEARDFLTAIEKKSAVWPTFKDGLAVSEIVEACFVSQQEKRWVSL